MPTHNPVNWFEIPVTDIERAKAFYNALLGFSFEDMAMDKALMAFFPMEQEAPGSGGALVQCEGYTPTTDGVALYFSVSDIEAILAKAEAAGGSTLVPKTEIGQFGWFAHLRDTEGNRIGIHTPASMD